MKDILTWIALFIAILLLLAATSSTASDAPNLIRVQSPDGTLKTSIRTDQIIGVTYGTWENENYVRIEIDSWGTGFVTTDIPEAGFQWAEKELLRAMAAPWQDTPILITEWARTQ